MVKKQKPKFRIAVVEDGVVVNTIVADSSFKSARNQILVPLCKLCPNGIEPTDQIVEHSDEYGKREPSIGWKYVDGKFIRPNDSKDVLINNARYEFKRMMDEGVEVEGIVLPTGAYVASQLNSILLCVDLQVNDTLSIEKSDGTIIQRSVDTIKDDAKIILTYMNNCKNLLKEILDEIENGEIQFSEELKGRFKLT